MLRVANMVHLLPTMLMQTKGAQLTTRWKTDYNWQRRADRSWSVLLPTMLRSIRYATFVAPRVASHAAAASAAASLVSLRAAHNPRAVYEWLLGWATILLACSQTCLTTLPIPTAIRPLAWSFVVLGLVKMIRKFLWSSRQTHIGAALFVNLLRLAWFLELVSPLADLLALSSTASVALRGPA